MAAPHRTTLHQKKRHGHHQKHTSHFLKVYYPYLPFMMIVLIGLFFTFHWHKPINRPSHSQHGVLAYATNTTASGLLAATNTQRASNGRTALSLNGKLAAAAQAKANDMVTRDYWSHNTPDGNPPWVFIDQAGYSYLKAGENLAYGFLTSDDTVTGWMNSPGHRANLLDSAFSDVGFGIANSPNYVSTGQETVVVAMYGEPKTAAAPAPVTAAPIKPAPKVAQAAPATAPATPAPVTNSPVPTPPTPTAPAPSKPSLTPVTSATLTAQEPASEPVSRLAAFTGGRAPWLMTGMSLTAFIGLAWLFLKHSWNFGRFIRKSERYVLHHALFDLTIVSLVALCLIVSQSAGFIR